MNQTTTPNPAAVTSLRRAPSATSCGRVSTLGNARTSAATNTKRLHNDPPMPRLLPLLLITLLAAPAHSAPRESATTPAQTLFCTGPFARAATHASVVRAFGKGNVTSERVGEGEAEPATVVFARDRTRRLEIFWRDAKRRRGIGEVRTQARSRWRTTQSVTVGMALADVEAINGRPFLLAGFGWDYGGTTTDWQGGALAAQDGGCRLMLRFEQTQATNADIDSDRDMSADDAGIRSAKPVVEEISLRFE